MIRDAGWPSGHPAAYVSPSRANDLLECPLRLAFRGSGGDLKPRPKSVAQRLGIVCHEVLEAAARGDLAQPDDPGWTDALEYVWGRALAAQEVEAKRVEVASYPPLERWPERGIKRAQVRRLARDVAARSAGASLLIEEQFESADGAIRGRPDVVIRSPAREIWDFKTGGVTAEDDSPVEAYRVQLMLYAKLELDATGEPPGRLVLIPLAGSRRSWAPRLAEIESLAARVVNALALYNAAISNGTVGSLGRPSPRNCQFCHYAPRCPAFWSAYGVGWWESADAFQGTIVDRRVAARGAIGVTVVLDSPRGTTSEVTVSGITFTDQPGLASAGLGRRISVVGVLRRGPAAFQIGPLSRSWSFQNAPV